MEGSFQSEDRTAWRAWLAQHHTQTEGVWLVTYKKSSGKPHLAYGDAVEEALCFGWVDSKPRKVDEARSKLWFAPRKAKSGWSRPNKERIARMMAAGLMHSAGLAKIDAAKKDGSWTALDAVEDLVIDADLAAALAQHAPAAQNFDAFPRSAKRGILEWIAQAKRAETRAARISETARLAQRNERANLWKPKA